MHQTVLGVNLLSLSGSSQRRLLPYCQNLSSLSQQPPLGGLFGNAKASKHHTFRFWQLMHLAEHLLVQGLEVVREREGGHLKTKIKREKPLGASLTTSNKMDVLHVLPWTTDLYARGSVVFVKACWVDLLGGEGNCYRFARLRLGSVGGLFVPPQPVQQATSDPLLSTMQVIPYKQAIVVPEMQ